MRTGAGPEGVSAAFGSVWLVAQDAGRLLRVDPGPAEVTARIKLGVGARLVAPGPDAMYVAHYADNRSSGWIRRPTRSRRPRRSATAPRR